MFVELVNEDGRRDEQRSFSQQAEEILASQIVGLGSRPVILADVDVESLAVIRDLDL